MRRTLLLAVALVGCQRDEPAPGVALVVDSPSYGAYLGGGPIQVIGRVTPSNAAVYVEGERATVFPDGRFVAAVPFEDRYRIIDVEAFAGDLSERVRVPVFDGQDPLVAWPGSVTARVTPLGLQRIGERVGAVVDATGWSALVTAALPSVDTEYLDLAPTGLTHDPTVVQLLPATGGIDTALSLRSLRLGYDLTVSGLGASWTGPMTLGFGEVAVGALAVPSVQEGMLSLRLTDATVRLDAPEIAIGGLDAWLVEWVVEGVTDWVVEPLAALLLDLVLSTWGTIPLGGPYAMSSSVMGMPVEVQLVDVHGDSEGLGAGLGLGIGEATASGIVTMPVPGLLLDAPEPVHAALGLHEGALQAMLTSELTALLTKELQLGGAFGELIGTGVRALPGGGSAPQGEGWCLALRPNPAQVVRMQPGTAPFAVLYMPDLVVDIGIEQLGVCETWLEASMAAKVGLEVRGGSRIGVDVDFVEGAVLSYASTSAWEEHEVVDGLASFLGGATTLLGNSAELDLAELLPLGNSGGDDPIGTVFGDAEPRIVTSEAMDAAGSYAIGLSLWPE